MNNGQKSLSINETFIIEGENDGSLSACTGFFTNELVSCTGNTQILLGTNIIQANSAFSATTFYGDGSNLTGISNKDTFVTGGTYNQNSGVATFTNNTGGTFSVTGFYTGATDVYVTAVTFTNNLLTLYRNDGATFGATIDNFTSLNVNGPVSATTFYGDGSNLTGISTQDTFVTGGTYSNGTAVFRNNTGGTFSVTGFSGLFTGGTVNGPTNFTNGLTANTFSAETYLNLPLDIYTTGVTYSNNQLFFNRNNGLSAYTAQLSGLSSYYYPLTGNPSGYLTQDNVVEYPDLSSFPSVGVIGTIYIAVDTGFFYTWNGTTYVLSSPTNTGITGIGLTNFIPKWTSPTTLGNSGFSEPPTLGGRYQFGSQFIEFLKGGSALNLVRTQSNLLFTLGVQNSFSTTIYSSQSQEGLSINSQGDFSISSGGPLLSPTQRLYINRNSGNIHIGGNQNVSASEKLQVTGNIRITGAYLDSNNLSGNTNQYLKSTITGTSWTEINDTFVTGGTYDQNSGVTTFTNNTGGTFSVTGFSGLFTGGTVNGPTNFTNGLTANTLSANTINTISGDVQTQINNKQKDLFEFQTKEGFYFFEDFLGNPGSSSINSYGISTSSTGAGSICLPTTTYPNRTNQQGVMQLGVGTTTTGNANIRIGDNNAGSHYLGNGNYIMQYYVNIETLSTVTERFFSIFGSTTSVNFTSTNGIFFIYDEGGAYGTGSANWKCVTRSGSIATITNTTIPVVNGQWYVLKIIINANATSVQFYVNNVLVATNTNNIPNLITPRIANVKTAGTNNRNVFVDYMLIQQIYSIPRTI